MEEVFGPQGLLASNHPNYEYRLGQVQMAKAVFDVLRKGGTLLCEAGTGTGKTLAYLVPVIALGKRVIVSTATKNLQEQLYNKDIPFLERLLKRRLRVTYLKGRSNYLCLYRLKKAEESPILKGLEEVSYFDLVRRWAAKTSTGDKAELVGIPESLGFWTDIDARSEICMGQKCPEFDNCFITRARQLAQESDIIIVNHHLFFADLSLKNNVYGSILPEYSAVVFDEAHEIEDIAAEYFGTEVSNFKISSLIQDLSRLAITDPHSASEVLKICARLSTQAERFWEHFYRRTPNEGRYPLATEIFVDVDGDGSRVATPTGDAYLTLLNSLERLVATLKTVRDSSAELDLLIRRCETTASELQFVVEEAGEEYVCWYERRGRGVFMQATPIDVSKILSERLFSNSEAVILTSATLTSAEDFEFIRKRLGTGPGRELKIESHFDYTSQSLLYLPAQMPDPRSPGYASAAAEEILKIVELTEGRAFVLFTSTAQMHQVYELLKDRLKFPALVQGQASKTALLERFKAQQSILFAVSSFWQGVDVQGEALSCVIIDRLPFAVPTDPVVSARNSYIETRGGNPFMQYSVPQAVITLKQGVGRLIRSRQDRGVVCILDPRLRTKAYGKVFLENLPAFPVTTRREDITALFGQHRK